MVKMPRWRRLQPRKSSSPEPFSSDAADAMQGPWIQEENVFAEHFLELPVAVQFQQVPHKKAVTVDLLVAHLLNTSPDFARLV